MRFVPRLGEITLEPLHYHRQSSLFAGLYQEMDMIPHNAEIPQAEVEPPLRLSDERQKQPLELWFKQAHVVMVYF
jgi:hypothetical protein